MADTKHTWTVDKKNKPTGSIAIIKDESQAIIADVWPCGTTEDSLSHARLIAAAPDLLAACKAAAPYLTTQRHADTGETHPFYLIKDAIAKAEGN